MPSFCAAYGCCNNSNKEHCKRRNISFHSFPLNKPEILQQWLFNMKRANFIPKQSSQLCSEHFEDHCFTSQNFTKRMLKEHSVPTKFNFQRVMKKVVVADAFCEKNSDANGGQSSAAKEGKDHASGDRPKVLIITCRPANDSAEKQDDEDTSENLVSPPSSPSSQVPSSQLVEQPTQSSPCKKRKGEELQEDSEDAEERRHREKMQRWDRFLGLMERLVHVIAEKNEPPV